MPQIARYTAEIAGVFVECIFYGVYLVTVAASLRTIALAHPELPWKARFIHQRPGTLIVVLLLFISSTLNLALGLFRMLEFNSTGSDGAEELGQDWVDVLKVPVIPVARFFLPIFRCSQLLSVILQTMIADCVLVSL